MEFREIKIDDRKIILDFLAQLTTTHLLMKLNLNNF